MQERDQISQRIKDWFVPESLAVSSVLDDAAVVAADFRIDPLGHQRFAIFLSAETSPELVNCIVELQPDDFWVKPLKPSSIESRLNYLLQIRYKLHKMLHCMKVGDYSTAMYYAERQLKDMSLSDYHPRIRRLIGECLLQLRDYETSENYYRELLKPWIMRGCILA